MDEGYSFVRYKGCDYALDYCAIARDLNECVEKNRTGEYIQIIKEASRVDLFFFLYFALGLTFLNNSFHVKSIREVQEDNDNMLDLWGREMGKSTIITKGLTAWEVLNNPELTCGIFSHNSSIARGFLRTIKTWFETNPLLRLVWSDVLWDKPDRQAPKWSELEGIVVKRNGVLSESTVEAYGLVDSQPTGKHYDRLIFDDIITAETINTPEMMVKTEERFKMALNLGRRGGKKRIVGTIYSDSDLHSKMRSSGIWTVRERPAEVDGLPVYFPRHELEKKKIFMGAFVYATQMLLKPVSGDTAAFRTSDLKYYKNLPRLNYYIVVDPADSKRNKADRCVMIVFGVDAFKNRYIVDMVADRLSLGERWDRFSGLVRKWHPLNSGYEKVGMQSDISYMKEKMDELSMWFNIEPVTPRGNKVDRILSLVPYFEQGKILLPVEILYTTVDGKQVDLVDDFISNEFSRYTTNGPLGTHDDMLDCFQMMFYEKLGVIYPFSQAKQVAEKKSAWNPLDKKEKSGTWMSL